MSGGKLVVLNSHQRELKSIPLTEGVATLGKDPANNIRITVASVAPYHASVTVANGKTVVRAVGGVTKVNGRAISVATLHDGDIISIAHREFRWDQNQPSHMRKRGEEASPAVALTSPPQRARGPRGGARRSAPDPAASQRALQLAYEMSRRASMPGSSGGKQVAIVQPQRRNASDQSEKSTPPSTSRRNVSQELNTSMTEEDRSKRKSNLRISPKNFLQSTTKATLWIESRKTSPRKKVQSPAAPAPVARRSLPHKKSTPLRMTVLKRAQSAHKAKVVKIQAPLKIDHTKQAAIMLMTGHTPKTSLSMSPKNRSSRKSPSYVVKKPSPVRKTPAVKSRQSIRRSKNSGQSIGVTPSRGSMYAQEAAIRRSSKMNATNTSFYKVSILEISDSTRNSTIRASNISTRSSNTPQKSPSLPSPKKSAMKDHSKKSTRKIESIKFDLSNLEGHQTAGEIMSLTGTTQDSDNEDITLRYSDSSSHSPSPSPRRPIHSRSSRILERAGTTLTSTPASPSRTLTPASKTATPSSPSARRSIRSSAMVQKALESSSDRTKTILSPDSSAVSDRTRTILSNTTASDRTKTQLGADSAFRTRTLSPRSNQNLEAYSVVDLVSFNTEEGSKSVYDSAGSASVFGTPASGGRKTRSALGGDLLGTSTPYAARSRPARATERTADISTRRSKSLSTPENRLVSVNSTRRSRASRSRSRINDSDLIFFDDTEDDASPKTSKRSRTKSKEVIDMSTNTANGTSTPENRCSPEAAGTPVISIQSLLDSSRSSVASRASTRLTSGNRKRKTIGVLSQPKRRAEVKSKSIGPIVSSIRKTRLRLSRDSNGTDEGAPRPDDEATITPRSAIKPSPEAVKNKHSTAKKPQSKRSIIDDLNSSDIVKQLFNSPVKRKLSQSMTEFSRRQLFEDEAPASGQTRATRRTTAARSPPASPPKASAITPERFVSPVHTPQNSPNISGLKRLFGVTPPASTRSRRSVKNDLTDVRGVKLVFANSPRDDMRRVTGVKNIFRQNSPKNDLSDVRGVRRMFQEKSPRNDLRKVSGVKQTFSRRSPRNDLSDVRGVRRMFKPQRRAPSYHDVSGVEELFDSSRRSADRSEVLFDMLLGKPPVKAVYSKTFCTNVARKPRTRRRSLRTSIDVTPLNVDEWLEQELQKRLPSRNMTKELQRLTTDTVQGSTPIVLSRTRNSAVQKSASDIYDASTLPLKKRSVVEASSERSRRQLPLKKRAVHSTPLKGRVEVTMNASELGRVSPIAALHHTADIHYDGFVSRSTQTINEVTGTMIATKPRTPRKQETPKKIEIAPKTPEPTPEKPAPKRTTKNRKPSDNSQANTKKRRSSLVVGKKVPVMSPKIKPTSSEKIQTQSPKQEPRKTRRARVSLVVAKASPKLKPQPAPKAKSQKQIVTPRKTRARKVTVGNESLKKLNSRARANKSASISEAKNVKPAPTKRGRKVAVEELPQIKQTRRTKVVEPVVEVTKPKQSRGRGTKAQNQVSLEVQDQKRPSRRGKAVETPTENPKSISKRSTRANKDQTSESVSEGNRPNSRGRKNALIEPEQENHPKGRGRKAQNIPKQTEPEELQSKGRGRRAQIKNLQENTQSKNNKMDNKLNKSQPELKNNTRSKKVEIEVNIPSKEPRSRRANFDTTTKTETRGRKRKAATNENVISKKSKPEPINDNVGKSLTVKGAAKRKDTKSSKTIENAEKETKPTRGRKNAATKENVIETTGRSKRKANIDPSPVKVAAKKPTRGTEKSPAPVRSTRTQQPQQKESTKNLRTRRR